jgi:carbonic anhydrase
VIAAAGFAFAVMELRVENIVVLGHAQCGGVSAALAGARAAKLPFLSEWIALLDPAVARCAHTGHEAQTALERETIKLSLERLMTFPFVAERVRNGELKLHGARFGIADGALEVLDPVSGQFSAVPRT